MHLFPLQAWDWLSSEELNWLGLMCLVAKTLLSLLHAIQLFVIFMVSFSSETTRRSVLHLLAIFLIASWCLFRISLLCSAFLKYFLFLSPPQHLLCLEILSFFTFPFLSFLPFLSSPPSLCGVHHFPSSSLSQVLNPSLESRVLWCN